MNNFYDIDIIPFILKRFKVNNIIISDLSDKNILHEILNYSNENNASIVSINSNQNIIENIIGNNDDEIITQIKYEDEKTLNALANLKDFDAVFLNDDPNWYTTFNELKVIKENNDAFPLVFICNNVFPHKYRDSYNNPDVIPDEFKNEYSRELILNNNIKIRDDFYHAIEENTSKNGVFTAINDFLDENSSIRLMDIRFLNGITILYPENNISQIRLNALSDEIVDYSLNYDNLSDSIIENQLLSNYISRFNISDKEFDIIDEFANELEEKERIINDFEDKVKFHDEELSLKNSQITGVNSQLSLKDTQIKSYESKLTNKEIEIDNLNAKLKSSDEEIDSLKSEIDRKNNEIKDKDEKFNKKSQDFRNKETELNNQISMANSKINSLRNDVVNKEKREFELNNQLKQANDLININKNQLNAKESDIQNKQKQIELKENELFNQENKLKLIEKQFISQCSKIENKEYCIRCFKEEIENNHLEIEYLKNESFTKKLLSPLAYIYLAVKSDPKEVSLNYKLYKAMKNSKCFDIGFYLNNNEDIQDSNWCKYFSPELHYICEGFKEERKFNKKYFNRNSKQELLDYIYQCEK